MSARSPFRSHLLQQWTNSRRSPIVVQQWLQQETIGEEEEGGPSSAPSRPSRHRREHNSRSLRHSSRQYHCPTLSSVDSSPLSPSNALTATSWAASPQSSEHRMDKEEKVLTLSSAGLSTGAPIDYKNRRKIENTLLDMVTPRNMATNEHGMTNAQSMKNIVFDQGEGTNSSTFTTKNSQTDEKNDSRELAMAIDRAIQLTKTINLRQNHQGQAREGPPFSFRKLLSSSRSGRQLIDICFEVTLRTTSSDSLARNERNVWSGVPAFLVAIVHGNQRTTHMATTNGKTDDDDPYELLGYSPPITEGQLEDYASACAAAQVAIHSLEGDGFATEWVTNSLIKTPAFRSLIKAKPTDRIAALIMVHDRPKCEKLPGRLI